MSQRLELFVIFLVCVVLCGCGTRSGEEISSADSNPVDTSQASQVDAAASADRLSEWVTSDDVAQPDWDKSAPQAAESSPWDTGDDATSQDLDAPASQPSDSTDSAIDSGDLNQGPSIEDYHARVKTLVDGGDLPAAVELAREAYTELSDNPQAVQLLINLSVLMVQNRNVDGALEVLETLQETSDSQAISPLLFQLYYLKSQRSADDVAALGYIQKSTEILRDLNVEQPGIANVFFEEAILLGKNQQDELAVASLRDAFEKGFGEISAAEEAFADNEAALKLIQELALPIRERLREEARAQMADAESFPFGFELPAVDGETTVSTEELKGKVVIVDLWGTWCPPCRKEIPHFVKLMENYGDDLAIVGVNFENGQTEEEKRALVNGFIAENGVTYPCVLVTESLEAQVPNIEGYPTTIFIGKDGKVRLKVVGYHSYDKLDAIIRELMSEEPAA